MKGQLTIFDTIEDGAPCRYTFKRYIGQRVVLYRGKRAFRGVIVEIKDYYTLIQTSEGLRVGTPYDLREEV